MKKDTNLIEALLWERDHGFLSAEECTRLIEQDTVPAVMVLQESATPPSPSKPPRFIEPPVMLSEGLDLSQYTCFKEVPVIRGRAASRPASASSPLTEATLIEARAALATSAADVAVAKSLPAGIHARLAAAVQG